jgi:hypothetical protein
MELLDRYLHAVRFWLPSRQQDDILAELSEDILSQIGEQEAKLGRELNESELGEILKRSGDPMLVAGRFLPQQQLIGPPWFPVYIFILKLVLLWVLLPLFILIASGTALLSAQDRALAFLRTLGGFWMGALSAFAAITIVFAVIDRFHHKLYEKEWDPRKLRAVSKRRDSRKIPRVGSVAEIVWGFIFILWWVNRLHVPFIPGNVVHITLSPVWQQFYWPIFLVSLAGILLACANLVRPWWSRLRAGIRLTIDATMAVMACLLMRMNPLVEITAISISGEELAKLQIAAQTGLSITFMIVAIISIFSCLQGVRRMMPAKAGRHSDVRNLAGGAAPGP